MKISSRQLLHGVNYRPSRNRPRFWPASGKWPLNFYLQSESGNIGASINCKHTCSSTFTKSQQFLREGGQNGRWNFVAFSWKTQKSQSWQILNTACLQNFSGSCSNIQHPLSIIDSGKIGIKQWELSQLIYDLRGLQCQQGIHTVQGPISPPSRKHLWLFLNVEPVCDFFFFFSFAIMWFDFARITLKIKV